MSYHPHKKERKAIFAELSSEYIFIITPFIFLIAIKTYNSEYEKILTAPDWSLVSCIIFGQSAVRLQRSAVKYRDTDDRQLGWYSSKRFFLASIPMLFYFGMTSETPSTYLGLGQIALFAIASAFHFKDGIASRLLETIELQKSKSQNK